MERGSIDDLQFSSNKRAEQGIGIKTWVTGTWPAHLKFQAEVIEMIVYQGLTPTEVAKIMGCSRKPIYNALKKYYPKKGEYDIVMSIMSKV